MIQTIEIPHQFPARLKTYTSVAEIFNAAGLMADRAGKDIAFTNKDEALAFLHHDLNSSIVLETTSATYMKDWQVEFNRCSGPAGSQGRHQGAKVYVLLLDALEEALDDLDAAQASMARAVLLACGRREADATVED